MRSLALVEEHGAGKKSTAEELNLARTLRNERVLKQRLSHVELATQVFFLLLKLVKLLLKVFNERIFRLEHQIDVLLILKHGLSGKYLLLKVSLDCFNV